MKTMHKLVLLGMGVLAVVLASSLSANRQVRAAGEAAGVLAVAQGVRIEALLQALYVADLVSARQYNDTVGERESIRLINGTIRRIDALLLELDEGGGPQRLPGARTIEEKRDLRDCTELWRLYRDAAEEVMRGRAVSRNADFVKESSVRLVQRLSNVVGAAQRRQASCGSTARTILIWACILTVVLAGALAWTLHAEVFAGFRRVVECMDLLGSGTVSPDVTVPEGGKGDVGRFALHVNRFLERLREADRTKDRFLAAMSHEIRTPMNGVIGFLGNLRETPLNEQQRQYLRVIESSARNLLRVINSILDFSKLTAGRMGLEEVAFDLRLLLDDSAAMTRQFVRGKHVRVFLDAEGLESCVVRADPTRLRQVLDNLLSNAAKFTERGEIHLVVKATPIGDDRLNLEFSVSDTGIGITAEQQQHLFEAFSQAESGTTRKYGGTGLGLCIASSLVNLMGGQLAVESRPGEGSTFSFGFAARTARPEEQVQLSGHYRIKLPRGALRRFWALLVDDTPTNLFLMETICQSIGLPYRTAINGKDAVDLAQQQRFDLIFMDIQMPVMDGYTAIREIRKLPNSGGTQIIALTASAFQEDVERALGAGSTGFLAKPFERDHLLLCIAQHLDISVERELREPVESSGTQEEMLVRHMYDFMREQYQVSLGEIKMILVQSVSDWRPLLDDLSVFARRGDWEEVRSIMHRLKGQLASIGLPHFAETAGGVTASIREGHTEGLQAHIQTFAAGLGAVFKAIEREVTVDVHPPA